MLTDLWVGEIAIYVMTTGLNATILLRNGDTSSLRVPIASSPSMTSHLLRRRPRWEPDLEIRNGPFDFSVLMRGSGG